MMRTFLLWIGRLGLVLTIAPFVLFVVGVLGLPMTKLLMILGMVLWFVSSPIVQRLDR